MAGAVGCGTVRRCATLDEYQAAPVGRFIVGRTYAHYYLRPGLDGLILFGRPDLEDAKQLGDLLEVQVSGGARATLLDARRADGIDADAFARLISNLEIHWRRPIRFAERFALLRPTRGLSAAIAAGFLEVATPMGTWRVFTDLDEALAWIAPGEDLRAALAEVEAAVDGPEVLRALREWLVAHPAGASLARAAQALASSPRSLQRKLTDAGTTFRAEHQAAQVQVAMKLITESDAKLTTIAHEVGCSSLQHFSTLFSRVTGRSPSAYRRVTAGVTSADRAPASAPSHPPARR
jgi:AraC-like DNA-binding protein